MQEIREIVEAYEDITNPKASLLAKAHGYTVILRELFDINVEEHKTVSLRPLPTDSRFLQSLCTRLSKQLKAQSEESEEDSEEEAENSDTEEKSEMAERFENSDKSLEEFIEELKEELKESELVNEEDQGKGEQRGGGSTPQITANAHRSFILESLIESHHVVTTVHSKRNYKRFLPKVWINPLVPYTFKSEHIVKKPLVVFYESSGGYGHQPMIAALKALPKELADVFMSESSGLEDKGLYNKSERLHFWEIELPKTILIFTNGCNTSHNIANFCKKLTDLGHVVEVHTMFSDHSDCGCPTFNMLKEVNVPLYRNLKV